MISTWLMKALLVAYVIITAACIYERDWPKMLHWVSACGITTAILWGMKYDTTSLQIFEEGIMARPERHDADYFPFYVKDGKTLFILESKYGLQGVGFFTNLMRFLTRQTDHHICIADESDRLYFFAQIKCPEDMGIDILNLMAKTGKINKELWENHKIIMSEDLLKSLEDAYKNRKNKIVTVEQILEGEILKSRVSYQENAVSYQENPITYPHNPQRKGKERKLNKYIQQGNPADVCGKNIFICPHKEIVDLYHSILPALTPVKEWTEERQKLLRTRWKEKTERQSLDWWKNFFLDVSKSDFLTGKVNGFKADLEWLIRPKNFIKVLEGKYRNVEHQSKTEADDMIDRALRGEI